MLNPSHWNLRELKPWQKKPKRKKNTTVICHQISRWDWWDQINGGWPSWSLLGWREKPPHMLDLFDCQANHSKTPHPPPPVFLFNPHKCASDGRPSAVAAPHPPSTPHICSGGAGANKGGSKERTLVHRRRLQHDMSSWAAPTHHVFRPKVCLLFTTAAFQLRTVGGWAELWGAYWFLNGYDTASQCNQQLRQCRSELGAALSLYRNGSVTGLWFPKEY